LVGGANVTLTWIDVGAGAARWALRVAIDLGDRACLDSHGALRVNGALKLGALVETADRRLRLQQILPEPAAQVDAVMEVAAYLARVARTLQPRRFVDGSSAAACFAGFDY
jgi:hypothetical protein